tara:strand:+ start:442 stop:666 length:225 start_codon:yes stop_codon:yes gene_type:complete
MSTRDQIAADIEAFIERTGMPPATFGRRAMSDPMFVFELRGGKRDMRSRTVDKLRAFMASYRPPRGGNESRAAA